MGGGASRPPEYKFSFHVRPLKVPERVQYKLPKLKKHDSAPHLIADTTVFCNYVDVSSGDNLVQRNITKEIKSRPGKGQLSYRSCNWYEFNKELPWLLKNAFFTNPAIRDFDVHRTIGEFILSSRIIVVCVLIYLLLYCRKRKNVCSKDG